MTDEALLQQLDQSAELQRRVAVRVAMDILESEAFMESEQRAEDPEELKSICTRLLLKNEVDTEAGRGIFSSLAESYTARSDEA